MSGALQQRDEIAALSHNLRRQKETLAGVLPSHIPFEKFERAIITGVQRSPALLAADRASLYLAAQDAAGMGLLCDGREGALVIFGAEDEEDGGQQARNAGGKPKRVVFMPMIRGLLKLVRNTGTVASVSAEVVYQGEHVRISAGDDPCFEHERSVDPNFDDSPANIIGAYAIVRYKSGDLEREWMSRRQIDRVRAVSRSRKGPWLPWYDEMARKTVLRRLLKRLDTSAELKAIDQVLDSDTTMTIEGEADAAAAALAPPRRTMAALEHQIDVGATTLTQPAEKVPPARAQPPRAAPPPPPPPPPPPADPAFEAWLVDEQGEVLPEAPDHPARFTDPVLYARELVNFALSSDVSVLGGILDANAEGIAWASRESPEAADTLRQITDPPPKPAADPLLVEMPLTGKGSPHLPNYVAAVRASIAAIEAAEQLAQWVAVNSPVFSGMSRSTVTAIEAALSERRTALGVTAGAAPEPPPDKDAIWTDGTVRDIAVIEQLGALNVMRDNMILRSRLERYARERPELAERIETALHERQTALSPRGTSPP